jgi:phage protein D
VTSNLDLYAPTFSIEIDDQRIETLEKAVINLTVEDSIEQPSMFSLDIYESLDIKTQKFKWLDNNLLDPANGKEVKIYLGYANSPTNQAEPLITGSIVALTPSFPSTGIPSLSIQGYNHSYKLQKPMEKDANIGKENKDYADIVKKIAKRHDLQEGKIDPIAKIDSLTIDSEDRFGYEFFVRNNKLNFRNPKDIGDEAISLTWGKELISFNPRMSTAEVVSKVTVKGPDLKDRSKIIEGSADLSDLDFKEKAARSAADYIKSGPRGNAEIFMHDFPVRSQEEAKAIAKAILVKKNNNFISGTCECIGIPDIRPGTKAIIKGVGKRFNGTYYIKNATHSLGDMGYKLTLGVSRGGIGTA